MKRILRYLGALLFAGMPFSVIHGENITHNFQSMNTEPRTIEFESDKYASSTTDAITYTCGGTSDCRFWIDHVSHTFISINLLNNGDYVIISPAIDNLRGFDIFYEPANEKRETIIQVYLSTDGISWGEALTGENINYEKGVINVTPPSGSYQIKIVDINGSYDTSITEIDYMIENCNCFRYVP
jgi:hypothetical protein